MKITKAFAAVLALMLVLALGLSLVACGGGDDPCTEHVDANSDGKCDKCEAAVEPDDGGDEGNGGTTPAGDIELVKNGKASFTIVSTEDTSTAIGRPLTNFVKNVNDCISDGTVTAVFESTPASGTEIILGNVSTRGNKYTEAAASPYAWGYEGWSVQIVDGNIFVLAGSASAYKDAIEYIEETVFGISDDTMSIDNVTMKADQVKTEAQTEFDVNVKIGDTPLNEYVFAINSGDTTAINTIKAIRTQIFKKTGAYLKTVTAADLADGQKAVWIETVELNGERTSAEGAQIYVKDGNLHIESEFPNKLEQVVTDYLVKEIAESKKSNVTINTGLRKAVDVRNIYYADFGAVGDGVTDDFYAIKACHDYANEWGHTANADGPTKTYYIGNYLGSSTSVLSIEVQTDTNWHGCTFIWDDSVVPVGSGCYKSPIFSISPSEESWIVPTSELPKEFIAKGSLRLGNWTPGVECLVHIANTKERHYIRYGLNENNGSDQNEILHVYADGTIDTMTPLQWDYENVSWMIVYPLDTTPITVSGGDGDQRTTVRTIFNGARSLYTYYARNFQITRSNVTLQNINHEVEGEVPESLGGTGAPYSGFTFVTKAHNVTIQNMLIHNLQGYHLENNKSNGMGTYEMNASYSNNLWYKNIKQDVFFDADGGVSYEGLMGTNYCKNLGFDGNFICSFDAHCGVYNGTILNSIVEHLNFIGDGLITIENTTLYLDGSRTAVQLRSDYGATWRGDLYMKDVNLKYQVSKADYNHWNYSLVSSAWTNHSFGYTCYLPQDIYIENVNMLGFDVKIENGERIETITETNTRELYLFTAGTVYYFTNVDLSDPDADMTNNPNDWKQCTCATREDKEFYNYEISPQNIKKYFNDTDGDGRCNNVIKGQSDQSVWCWGFKEAPDKSVNANPYIGTKTVTVVNGDPTKPLKIVWPLTPQFKDMDVTVDGEVIIENGTKVSD